MKQFKTILLATALCIGTVSFTQAQSKVAHINTQELISAMPEMKAAQGLYKSRGFKYLDCSKGNTCHSACQVFMEKKLS